MTKGIEVLKQGIETMLDVAKTIVEATTDKKITFAETIKIGMKAFPIADVIRKREGLANELNDLTPQEKAELHSFIVSKFDIPNDKAEKTAEEAIALFVQVLSFGFSMSQTWKK